jgi:prepilin-type N-terminal cleavage/methylation domain-containing protein
MRRASHTIPYNGYCLAELLIVLAILGICTAAGAASYSTGLRRQEARGAAQAWQAEAAWGQTGVLWQGGDTKVGFASGDLSVTHDLGLCGGNLGACAPASSVSANVPRWRTAAGAEVTFGGTLASPDSGGSLYFEALGGAYKVVVRPESGLTARSWVER